MGREGVKEKVKINNTMCEDIESNDERGCDKDCGRVGGLEEG